MDGDLMRYFMYGVRTIVLAFLLGALACHSYDMEFIDTGAPSGDAEMGELTERMQLWFQVARPSVQIISPLGGTGSGTVVHQNASRALILTAAHVVSGFDGQPLTTCSVMRDGQKVNGKVLKADVAKDLALVRTDPVWREVAQLYVATKESTLGWGSRVVIFGHPLGETEGILTDGRITSVNDEGRLRYSAPTFFGNSGGGVFARVDQHWVLISVVQLVAMSQSHIPVTHMGRGVRPDILITYLKGIEDVR